MINDLLFFISLSIECQGLGFIFDKMEGDEDGNISWDEFRQFFENQGNHTQWIFLSTKYTVWWLFFLLLSWLPMSSGWCEPNGADENENRSQLMRTSQSQALSHATMRTSSNAVTSSSSSKAKITYVIERCASELDNVFTEVMRTTADRAQIARLEPGHSYRFRLYALNDQDQIGWKSERLFFFILLKFIYSAEF